MNISKQTTADLTVIFESLDQRIHEMTCSEDAVNAAHPAEVAALADLKDEVQGLLDAALEAA